MKVMVFVKASAESEAGGMPDEKLLTAMGRTAAVNWKRLKSR